EAQGGEITDPPLVHRWLECKVELIQRLAERQMGKARTRLDEPVVLGEKFFSQKLVQELQIRYIRFRRFFGVLMDDLRYANPPKMANRRLQSLLQNHWSTASSMSES